MEHTLSEFYLRLGHARWREFGKGTTERIFEGRVAKTFLQECRLLNFSPYGKRILDVGCGAGELVYHLSDVGDVMGIEPDTSLATVANEWLQASSKRGRVLVAAGERIPFSDETFDIVICHHVIEHCRNPQELISEIVRVLKRPGMGYIKAPNYDIPYEPHYRLLGLPVLPRSISRLTLLLLRRNPDELDNINMRVKKRWVDQQLKRNGVTELRDLVEVKLEHPNLIRSDVRRLIAIILKTFGLTGFMIHLSPDFGVCFFK